MHITWLRKQRLKFWGGNPSSEKVESKIRKARSDDERSLVITNGFDLKNAALLSPLTSGISFVNNDLLKTKLILRAMVESDFERLPAIQEQIFSIKDRATQEAINVIYKLSAGLPCESLKEEVNKVFIAQEAAITVKTLKDLRKSVMQQALLKGSDQIQKEAIEAAATSLDDSNEKYEFLYAGLQGKNTTKSLKFAAIDQICLLDDNEEMPAEMKNIQISIKALKNNDNQSFHNSFSFLKGELKALVLQYVMENEVYSQENVSFVLTYLPEIKELKVMEELVEKGIGRQELGIRAAFVECIPFIEDLKTRAGLYRSFIFSMMEGLALDYKFRHNLEKIADSIKNNELKQDILCVSRLSGEAIKDDAFKIAFLKTTFDKVFYDASSGKLYKFESFMRSVSTIKDDGTKISLISDGISAGVGFVLNYRNEDGYILAGYAADQIFSINNEQAREELKKELLSKYPPVPQKGILYEGFRSRVERGGIIGLDPQTKNKLQQILKGFNVDLK